MRCGRVSSQREALAAGGPWHCDPGVQAGVQIGSTVELLTSDMTMLEFTSWMPGS